LGERVQESTVQCIKKAVFKKIRVTGSNEVLESLTWKKQGRPLLLVDRMDDMVQVYVKRVHEEEGTVSSQIVIGAARGIL